MANQRGNYSLLGLLLKLNRFVISDREKQGDVQGGYEAGGGVS